MVSKHDNKSFGKIFKNGKINAGIQSHFANIFDQTERHETIFLRFLKADKSRRGYIVSKFKTHE